METTRDMKQNTLFQSFPAAATIKNDNNSKWQLRAERRPDSFKRNTQQNATFFHLCLAGTKVTTVVHAVIQTEKNVEWI